MNISARRLPTEYQSLALLARTAESEVHHARGAQGEVALRIAAASDDAPGRAELGVLAAVDHPGLARLIGFGRVVESLSLATIGWRVLGSRDSTYASGPRTPAAWRSVN